MSEQFLSLSLFVILLTFFVFLTSLLQYDEERTKDVTRSLDRSFSRTLGSDPQGTNDLTQQRKTMTSGDHPDRLKALEGLFQSSIVAPEGFAMVRENNGTTLHITLPMVEWDIRELQNTLISLLQADLATNGAYHLDILLQGGITKQNLDSASDLALQLETLGLPERLVRVGVTEEGEMGLMDFYVRPYASFDPRGEKP